MSQEMRLKLTLWNENAETPLHLSALAPKDGWQSAPLNRIEAGESVVCEITAANTLAITLNYGTCHIGIHLDDDSFSIEPGTARVDRQKLGSGLAEVTLALG
ncbi:hypothetical protein [Thalassospira tepidiphila]|uniref:hypothetical protein n=1 Tax=Thalassospira tepidiphila TaxID=393657 RepID=UPI0029236E0D|nr:hypothetical protein MACH01_37190 [Thalassospira tepidiphila]